MSLLAIAALSTSARAQQIGDTGDGGPDPTTVRVRIGPLWMNPRIEVPNIGIDTNVFDDPADANPKRDFTATVTPTTDIWLRIGRSWLRTNIREDLVWFQKYSSERSVNNSYLVEWRMPLNRLAITLSPNYLNTRERPGYEIDARAKRIEWGGRGLLEVRALSKTFFGVAASYRKVDYDPADEFLGVNLRDELNRTEKIASVTMRQELTPLTTINVAVGQEQDRFKYSPLRDADSTNATLGVSFDPHALLKGSASIGYRDFRPLVSTLPAFTGMTATGDLTYTLLGTTRFQVGFKRDISFSYDIDQPYYLETGFNGSIAQQIFGPLDVVGRFGASQLAYRDRTGAVVAVADRVDHVHTYGGGIGYHFGGNTRIGFNVDQVHRTSALTQREYDGLRYGTSVTYDF